MFELRKGSASLEIMWKGSVTKKVWEPLVYSMDTAEACAVILVSAATVDLQPTLQQPARLLSNASIVAKDIKAETKIVLSTDMN